MDKDFIKLEKESKKNQTKIEDVTEEKEEKKGKKGYDIAYCCSRHSN